MAKYKHVIDDVEVILNERCGNYAKITLLSSFDALTVRKYYSGKYWHKYKLTVTLKPWKAIAEAKTTKKRHEEIVAHTTQDIPVSRNSYKSAHNPSSFLSMSKPHYKGDTRKPGYAKGGSEFRKRQKRMFCYKRCDPSGYCEGHYSQEYPIKLSGLTLNVKEKDIFKLVKPFGTLTRPIRVARYPENQRCYAYADYCSKHSAIQAVHGLDESEFGGSKIHVCHRGELEVVHSCKEKLHALLSSELASSESSISRGNTGDAKEIVYNTVSYNGEDNHQNSTTKCDSITYGPVIIDQSKISACTLKPDISESDHKSVVSTNSLELATQHLPLLNDALNDKHMHTLRLSSTNLDLNALCSTEYLSSDQPNIMTETSCASLAVTNIHPGISIQELEMHLKSYGSLAAPISIQYESDCNSCSAVVHYVSVDDSITALSQLHGSSLNGYQLHVINCGNNMADANMVKIKGIKSIAVEEFPTKAFGKPLQQVTVRRANNESMSLLTIKKKSCTTW